MNSFKKDLIDKLSVLFILVFTGASLSGQKLYDPPVKYWEPIRDDVYLQDKSVRIKTDEPVQAVAK